MINKFLIIICFYNINAHASAAASLSDLQHKPSNAFIVILKNGEEIVSHKYTSYFVTTTHQQAIISCPNNAKALNLIRAQLSDTDKIKREDQIELRTIINPILPIITQYIQKGLKTKNSQGFLVCDNYVIPAIFDIASLTNFRVFTLEDNPISAEWFNT